MIVMVDSNEEATNPEIVALLRKTFPELQIMPLEFGDINIVLENGSLLSIERKNASDLLSSIGDGRVFNQVERMSAGSKFYAIILLGELSFDKDDMTIAEGRLTGWKGVSVRAAIYALQWSGCPVVRANKHSLSETVVELIKFCEHPEKHQQVLGHKRIVTFPPVDPRVEIIAAFPGIGLKKAESLLRFARSQNESESDDEFGTIAEALTWGSALNFIKSSARPEGWGDKVIQNFRLSLGLDSKEYVDIKKDGKK